MVEKNFTDRIRVDIDNKDATFKHHSSGFKSFYDEDLLQKHLPPTSGVLTADSALVASLGKILPEATIEALKETNFVNVYGRVLQGGGLGQKTCLQYIYVWDYQAVPAHEGDYEPIFVFLDGNERYAIYDLVHYCTRRIELGEPGKEGPGLRVIPGWHSFLPVANLESSAVDKGLSVKPLTDQHLDSWWNIPEDEPRLKIEKFFLDPFKLKAPGHFLEHPDEDAKTICCIFVEIEKAMAEFDNPKEAVVEGVKRAFGKCVGIFALHRLGAFISLLGELNDIGMINSTVNLKDGLNIGAIAGLLRDGFVSLTTKGAELFEGFQKSDEE